MMFQRKSGAIELSMTTMIVIVLSLVMLILGFVFVRSIMCAGIGLTQNVGNQIDSEVQRLFETSSSEVACFGFDEALKLVPGTRPNTLHCVIKSPAGGTYNIQANTGSIRPLTSSLTASQITSWISLPGQTYANVAPGEKEVNPIIFNIPDNAPEGSFVMQVSTTRDGQPIQGDTDLSFQVTRVGAVRNIIC